MYQLYSIIQRLSFESVVSTCSHTWRKSSFAARGSVYSVWSVIVVRLVVSVVGTGPMSVRALLIICTRIFNGYLLEAMAYLSPVPLEPDRASLSVIAPVDWV